MSDIFIRGLPLPIKVKGVTVTDPDGNFNVYINILLSYETQQQTQRHELAHIIKDHFYDCKPVVFNELEANAS